MSAYYNENDSFAAAWLRELIKAGLIADGEVDERSIELVRPDDLRGFTQCHFFAGIGGWSYALRLAGWPDDREVWTGSCPCQPFSSAGTQAGGHDPRDLWPVWCELVTECRPVVVFGEQVEAAIGHGWLDRLCDDLEAEGYAIGACGLPAACAGAPHGRPRLWFVADAGHSTRRASAAGTCCEACRGGEENDRAVVGCSELGDAYKPRPQGRRVLRKRADECVAWPSGVGDVAIADEWRREIADISIRPEGQAQATPIERGAGFWSTVDWISCADGARRPVEPGAFPLAHGIPARVGRLRGYGNAIVPQVAQVFIEAYLDCEREGLHP